MQTNASDTLAEQLRLYYLQQLGVTPYLLREAPAAIDPELPERIPDDAEPVGGQYAPPIETVASQEPPAREVRTTRLSAAFDESTVPARVAPTPGVASALPAATAQETTTRQTTTQEMPAAAFQLLFACTTRDLAVVLQLPTQAPSQLTAAEQRLLGNILQWLGVPAPAPDSWRAYRWPLPGLPTTTLDASARGLRAFLDQATSERAIQQMIVLGRLPMTSTAAAPPWALWETPSLNEMLKVPALKRTAWQALQPLQAVLCKLA